MLKKINYNDTVGVYRIEGSGLPVIFIHGFPLNGNIWNQQIHFLSEYAQPIAPDLPGSGQSELILHKPSLSIDDFADWIKALLDEENIKNCILLGHSMGGYITLSFAEKYPTYLKAFGLIHSTAKADSEEKKEMRKKGIENIQENGAEPFIRNAITNLFSKKFKTEHSDIITKLIEDNKHISAQALQQYYLIMMRRPERTEVLKQAKVPVLFILGKEDTTVPLEDGLQQAALPSVSYIHIIENAAHMSMIEAANEVNTYLLQFIQTCS